MKELEKRAEIESLKAELKRIRKKLEEERKLFIGGPVVVFKWKADEGRIPVEYVSPNVKDVFGYSPEEFISGKITYYDIIHPDDRERVIAEAQNYRHRGISQFEQEYRIITADGKYKWVHDFTVIKKNSKGKITHYHGYLVDITERKKMEEALKGSEERYKALFDRSLYLIYLHDFEGNFVDANEAILNLLGYERKEIPSLKLSSLIDEEQLTLAFKNIEELKKRGYQSEPNKYKLKKKDGSHIWIEAEASIVYKDGEPYAIQGVARDITRQKEAEEKLRKSNRMFKVLYKCNEVLIFAKNEKKLLDGICNTIVKDGRYLLVWVGYAGKEKKVEVAAACGKHTDYVNKIRVFWGKNKFGKGPTGTAIKTGKASIERDIEHSDNYSTWREEAMKHGFKSSIALPLIANGKTIGALSIYSGEINAFDEEEVDLLSQLADDLAYGITSLRNKAEKERMEEALEKERAQLLSIFEGIDEPIYVADPETYEILYVNRALKNEFGGDIIGRKCYKIFQNLDKPCDFCTNDKIFGKNFGKTYVWEFQNARDKRWYRCIDRGITWPDGRKVRMEIAIDITDRVKAEEETKRALELEKQFKLEAAHYFFNPIAIAKGYLSLAIEEAPEKQMEKLKAAEHAIERVEKVVKNVTQKGEIHE